MKRATCTYIIKGNETLMAEQQFKIVGRKGYGGVIEDFDESVQKSACREVWEETGGDPACRVHPEEEGGIIIFPDKLELVALIDFYNGSEEEVPPGDPSFRVLFLRTFDFEGTAISTREMLHPRWDSMDKLPFEEMIPGDDLIIPQVLRGEHIKGEIRRSKDLKTVLSHRIDSCDPEDLVI